MTRYTIEIDNIFNIAKNFLEKTARKNYSDINYSIISKKCKLILGWHLQCYKKSEGSPKCVFLEFFIGSVRGFDNKSIDEFLETYEYDGDNGFKISILKASEVDNYKSKVFELIKQNNGNN